MALLTVTCHFNSQQWDLRQKRERSENQLSNGRISPGIVCTGRSGRRTTLRLLVAGARGSLSLGGIRGYGPELCLRQMCYKVLLRVILNEVECTATQDEQAISHTKRRYVAREEGKMRQVIIDSSSRAIPACLLTSHTWTHL